MVIRDLQLSDVAVVAALNNANTPAVNAKTNDEMAYMFTQARWLLGAFDDSGGLLGFLITFVPGADYESLNFAWFTANHERFAYMDRIVVSPDGRGGGIGAALYAELFSLIGDAEPFVGIDVNLRPPNEGSLRFHRRLGFEEIHQHDTDGGAKTVSLLIKRLR